MADARLTEIPLAFAATRNALHSVAEQIVSPARAAATGDEFSLVVTAGGFGTPALPGGGCVRVDGLELVVDGGDGEQKRAPLTTLRESAAAVDLPSEGLSDEALELDDAAAGLLAGAYVLADAVLRDFYGEALPVAAPTGNQLWPEHFDIAIEHGDEPAGTRATYGLSPGDAAHSEPYFYVAPWSPPSDLTIWTAVGFTGAELNWSQLVEAEDPRVAALQFFREYRDALALGD
ncbi:unannotated protein [freshwater metagenome]|uniref:Unannotated protein n=1 Tax=freshwater metagenome TaxID=449393 RepID=A0A6J7S5N3_9ZZZZ|nr:hypothetical protein [Actinomycetota bacterium]MSX12671.1 hypothetical protein [Actinomycetota bacterium]